MIFEKEKLYVVETVRRTYLARYSGYDAPFILLEGAIVLDDGKYLHFLKTGTLTQKDLKGAYSFGSGFSTHERFIMNVIEIGVKPTASLEVVKSEQTSED